MRVKILLSGVTGFLGSNLCSVLEGMGHEVHCISRISSSKKINLNEDSSVRHHFFGLNSELKSIFAGSKFDLFINCSTLYISEHQTDQIELMIKSNIEFPSFLLDVLVSGGLKNFINIGTSWENYNGTECNPVNFYAATKCSFEKIINYYESAFGLKAVTLYLTDTYGPNDPREKLINLLLRSDRKTFDLSPGDQLIDLLHIKDVCKAIILLIELMLNNQTVARKYQISSSEKLTLKELVEIILALANKKVSINWGIRPYRKREVMTPSCIFDNVPGWSQEIDLVSGLQALIKK